MPDRSTLYLSELIISLAISSKASVINSDVNTELKLIFSEGTEIYPEDKFIVRGTFWEKDGESLQPNTNMFATNWMEAPVVVNIKQYKGNVGQTVNQKEGYEVNTDGQ